MAVTAEVIEYLCRYFIRCKNCEEGAVYYIDESFTPIHMAYKADCQAGFTSRDEAEKTKNNYLGFVNALGLSM